MCTVGLLHKLRQLNGNPNYRLWLHHSKNFGSAFSHPKLLVLFTPKLCLQEYKMKEHHVSCLLNDIKIDKASWKSQTEMGLVFHRRLRVLLFLLVAIVLIVTFPIFSAFLTYAHIDLACVVKFSYLLVFSFREAHHLTLIVCSFQGIKQIILGVWWRHTYLYCTDVNIYVC